MVESSVGILLTPLGFKTGEEYIEEINDYQLVRKDSAP
jgi:hypothetical protein